MAALGLYTWEQFQWICFWKQLQWTLPERESSELYLGTTPMNFTYLKKRTLPENPFLRLLKMILGSRPVNLVWNHFPWTFGQSYLTETVFLKIQHATWIFMRCLISSSNAFSLSSCLHVSFGIQCHYLWKTLKLYYTRLLATFILKTHVFHRSSNCKNIWKLFGVILNTGVDVFLYLRYGFTYRLLFFLGGSQHMVLVHQAFRKSLLNFLWTSCDISWFSFVF